MKKLSMFFLSFLLYLPVHSQSWTKELDSIMSILGQNEIFHGQILISAKGQVKFSNAYGQNHDGSEITPETPIEIQSVSKWITSISIMKLYQDGKLDIHDPLQKYFPQLEYPGVEIRHMLNHTSGMPRFFEAVFQHWPQDQFLTVDAMIDLVAKLKLPPLTEPGMVEQYNQTAYMLLAKITEMASGQSFIEYVRKNILEPTEMTHTFFNIEKADYKENIGPANIDNLFAIMLGDGNMQSTAENLAKLDAALRTEKLLDKHLISLTYVPSNLKNKEGKYGYGGSLIEKELGKRQFQHIGQGSTSHGVVNRFIDSGDVLIVLHDQSVQYAFPVYMAIKNIWEGKPYELPKKRIAFPLSQELINKYIGDYGENGFMHLTTENGRIYIQPDGNPGKIEIIPSSETTFYFEDQAIDWEIYLDGEGNVIGFGPAGQKEHMMKRQK